MRLRRIALLSAVLSAPFSLAQMTSPSTQQPTTQAVNQQNAQNYCRVYFNRPKPGMDQQYEAGRKKHMQFHRSQKDTFTWHTWLIATGDNTGTYVTSTCGHSMADFDQWEARMGKSDTADGAINLSPSVQGGSNGFYVYRSDMSLAAANEPPAPMTAVTVYKLKPGTAPAFATAIRQATDAIRKQADWPKTSGWLQLVNGGDAPTFVLLNARKDWADFTPLPKTPYDVMTEVYGKDTADQIQKTIMDATEHLSTETATYRPDLSYMPGK